MTAVLDRPFPSHAEPEAPRSAARAVQPIGINLIGHASASLGLGVALRQLAHALDAAGIELRVLDIPAHGGRDGFDRSLHSRTVQTAAALDQNVNLVVLGAPELPAFVASPPAGLRREGRLQAALVWWELPDFPAAIIDALRTFDVLVAASPFIRDTLLRQVPGVPILHAPQPLALPAHITGDRARLQLPEDAFIAFMGFEPASGMARKNPFGAIEAFRRAFPNDPQRLLLVKLNASAHAAGEEPAELTRLRSIAKADPRIRILRGRLSESDLLTLYASCDVGLSLHRSEGFGLFPLEFMRLGRPVVATAWSGNLAYMNHTNACLVRADILPVDPATPGYGSKDLGIASHWAEPDIDHAAAWLRALAEDPARRARIGLRARVDALTYDAQARRLAFIDELASLLAEWPHRPPLDQGALLRRAIQSAARDAQRRAARQRRLDTLAWMRNLPARVKRRLARWR